MRKILSSLLVLLAINSVVSAQQFKISYSKDAYSNAFTGKVLLYLSKDNH